MSAARDPHVFWRFDAVLVDPARFRVVVNGAPQALEPKTFRGAGGEIGRGGGRGDGVMMPRIPQENRLEERCAFVLP